MASISKITIDGFKAFPNRFEDINLDGKNLLLYGENGSGKSSIYYALHCLLQSQVVDKSSIYFDPNASESLVNKDTHKDDAFIEVQFTDSDVKYQVSKSGYKEIPSQPVSILRDLNGECVFINHKFLFHFFSFRNSQFIDLFPVFIKDILPFTLTQDKSLFISQVFNDIKNGIERKGTRITKDYIAKIKRFNDELKQVVRKVNSDLPTSASTIYNRYFRDIEGRELRIILLYDNNTHDIPQDNTSYWLRTGYRYQKVIVAGRSSNEKIGNKKQLLNPVICLRIEERQEDGTWKLIEKPQSYFNEAKLTAIALSIRFSLVDTVNPIDGSFMALDDMLISLDMSNRLKVIRYLLDVIQNNYRLYILTHDRLFYHTIKRMIETQYIRSTWVFGGIYLNDLESPVSPVFKLDSNDKIQDIREAYARHDYFRCGTLMRIECERCLNELLPDSFKVTEDSQTKATIEKTLDGKILSLEEFCQKEKIDFSPFKNLKIYKDLFLNSTAHNDITSPFYKNEIKACLKAIEALSKINRSKELDCKSDVKFSITDSHGETFLVGIKCHEPIKILEYNGENHISYFSSCTLVRIVHGEEKQEINEGYKSLYEVYYNVCTQLGVVPCKDIYDILQDRKGYIKGKFK